MRNTRSSNPSPASRRLAGRGIPLSRFSALVVVTLLLGAPAGLDASAQMAGTERAIRMLASRLARPASQTNLPTPPRVAPATVWSERPSVGSCPSERSPANASARARRGEGCLAPPHTTLA